MGFRSTLISQEPRRSWPQWFIEKYNDFSFGKYGAFALSSETKTCKYPDLPEDIQRALIETRSKRDFVYIWLHECGGVTRVQINREAIYFTTPTEWGFPVFELHRDDRQDSDHGDWCGRCSNAERIYEKGQQ